MQSHANSTQTPPEEKAFAVVKHLLVPDDLSEEVNEEGGVGEKKNSVATCVTNTADVVKPK